MLICEYAECGELRSFIKHAGYFDIHLSKTYLEQILSAVKQCHKLGIIHRDLKLGMRNV